MPLIADELKIYRGDDFEVCKGVVVRQPTLGEICDFGEEEYRSILGLLTAEPFDMVLFLTKLGLDFTQVKPFQLFCLLVKTITPDKSKLLLGDLDLSGFNYVQKANTLVLMNNDGVEINEVTREILADYIRKIHHIPKQRYNKVKNEFAKNALIEEAERDARNVERRRKFLGTKSYYQPLISSMVNTVGFKYDWNSVWDTKVGFFFDALHRIQIIDNAKNLYQGLYTGCVKYEKVKKDLNWMQELKI